MTCAIDVLSNPDENDTEKRLDAVRTLNSLVAALSVNDGDYYDAIDIAFETGTVVIWLEENGL